MVYLDLVMLLNFLVDLLLLIGTNSLSGYPFRPWRSAAAAAVGGVYGGICLLPGFTFLSGTAWRLVFLGLMAVIAFGWNRSALRRGVLFVFLSMALGGIALGLGSGGVWALVGAAACVSLMCIIGFHGKAGAQKFALVELKMGSKHRVLTALYDTGNTLKDPVTGRPVLVVGSEVAEDLLGLSLLQLGNPVQTVTEIPGLRLIPYRAVGQPGGMLLAVRMDEVKMDGKKCDVIVAFAPQKLGIDGYEALAGGIS